MKFWTLLLCLSFAVISYGQEARLAQEYFRNGEFEKAAVLYEKLHQSAKNDFYFNRYIESLLALEEFEKAEGVVKSTIKKQPKNLQLYVTYGNILERQFKDEEAKKQYREAIKKVEPDQFKIIKLANAFIGQTKYDLAIETYERGVQMVDNSAVFAYNMGNLYQRKGDNPKMIEYYLNSLKENPGRKSSLQSIFQRNLQTEEDYLELQTQLYDRLQGDPDAVDMMEMLAWVFIQKKDYRNALRQAKALDKRLDENGSRIYSLAQVAANAKDYDAAIKAYDYIVDEKGSSSTYYIDAKRQALRCNRMKLVSGFDYEMADLKALEVQYDTFLNEFGKNRSTAGIVMELAELNGFYIKDLPKAISILNDLIAFPGVNQKVQAEGKLLLADFYLMQGEIWESTLLYSQVDKSLKDDLLGHEARFRNAKLSYYNGDFEWAQAQFSVLKNSTSKLIANDALDLSVFITDNLGLDTTAIPLSKYAEADLAIFQNKFDVAFAKLDSITTTFPDHGLEDDVWYSKAQIYQKQRDYDKAIAMYEKIAEKYPEEIRTDNSLFAMAEIYEVHLNDLEKSKALYERIFIDYSNSTFAVEARKRFRRLRGDDIQ